jgi:hypothetical protein
VLRDELFSLGSMEIIGSFDKCSFRVLWGHTALPNEAGRPVT